MSIKTCKKGSTEKLSANFRVSEFACHGSGCCDTILIDEKLVEYLQKIRDHFGAAVTITSGYRCEKHNKAVGGVTSSLHRKGMAADVVVKGIAPAEVAKFAESIGVLGIGLYETNKDGYFVHIDTREKKGFWYGQGQAYRSTFGGAYTKEQFVRDVQAACGAGVDGIAGPETIGKTVDISTQKNARHAAVEAVQKRLKALGYTEVGEPDGIAGPKFTSALAHFQQDCFVTGKLTAGDMTWQRLLTAEEGDA